MTEKLHENAEISFEIVECTNQEYHDNVDNVSSSSLKTIAKNGVWHLDAVSDMPKEHKPAWDFGTAFHKYVLEREDFSSEIVVTKKVDGRTKEGKAANAEYNLLRDDGFTLINEEEFETIKLMEASLMDWFDANPELYEKWQSCVSEKSFFGKYNDVPVKIRFDKICEPLRIAFDIKTTDDASKSGFYKACYAYRYDIQDVHYRMMVDEFIFIMVEKKAPYNVCAYVNSESRLRVAFRDWSQSLRDWAKYNEDGFAIRPQGIVEIN